MSTSPFPATMTLAGAVSMKIMDTQDSMIVLGLLIALGCGAGVGIANYALIRLLRIPPIIATLSSSFIVLSAAISYSRGIRIKPPPMLADFTTWIVAGVPVMAVATMVATAVMSVVLHRTLFGRTITALGQNPRAARLAGLPVDVTRFATYVMCGAFAGLNGYLLSGFSGGAALNMGSEYLLASIAVVVIGGTSVAGGFANLPGLWGAAMLLFLLVTMLNTFGFGAGVRLVLTGLIIITVIIMAGGKRSAQACSPNLLRVSSAPVGVLEGGDAGHRPVAGAGAGRRAEQSEFGDQQGDTQLLSAALVRVVQVTPSGDVITRLPVPVLATAQNRPISGDQRHAGPVIVGRARPGRPGDCRPARS